MCPCLTSVSPTVGPVVPVLDHADVSNTPETEKEKEIRLVEEKYEKLLGMAEGNAEATLNLEKEKEEALNEIYMKDAQNWIDMIMKKAEEKKAQDEIEETEQKERNQKP